MDLTARPSLLAAATLCGRYGPILDTTATWTIRYLGPNGVQHGAQMQLAGLS
jgi:hypothetical protein